MASDKKWIIKKIILPLSVLLISALIAAQIVKLKKVPKSVAVKKIIPEVEVLSAHKTTESFKIKGNGTITPLSRVKLLPQVSGKIIFVSPRMTAGGLITKGETLFLIDTMEYHLRVQSAKAFLQQQEMLLTTEEENQKIAVFEWQEFKKNNPDAEAGLLTLRQPQYRLAKANYNSALASLKLTKLNLERTRIKAPFAGVVKERNVDFGQLVGAGTLLATVLNRERLQIKIPVKREEIQWLTYQENGKLQKMEVTILAGSRKFKGQLLRIGAELNPQSRMIDLIIEATNDKNTHPQLLIGDFVEVELKSKEVENIYKLQRYMIDENSMIKTVKNDMIIFKKVNVIKTLDEYILISEGLSDGDQVITSNLEIATPNMDVKIK